MKIIFLSIKVEVAFSIYGGYFYDLGPHFYFVALLNIYQSFFISMWTFPISASLFKDYDQVLLMIEATFEGPTSRSRALFKD